MISKEKLYKYNVDNHRRVEQSLNNIEVHLRKAISQKDEKVQESLLPLYMLLIAVSAEARLIKIICEPKAFENDEITTIMETKSHIDRWCKVVDTAFYKSHGKKPITDPTIPRTAFNMHKDLIDLLKNELKTVIEIRNKLAHGQWEYPFKNWQSSFDINKIDIATNIKKAFEKENFLTLKFKRSLIYFSLNIVKDLVVSRRTLKRDFDEYYKRIIITRINLKKRSYDKYSSSLIRKRKRGEEKRIDNLLKPYEILEKDLLKNILIKLISKG